MMPAILGDTLLALGGSFAVSVLVKVTLALALALGAVRLARRSRAAVRHVTLTAAMAVAALLPAASWLSPSVGVAVPATPPIAVASPVETPALAIAAAIPIPRRGPTSAPAAAAPTLLRSTVLTLLWGLGTALCLVPMLVGLVQIRRLRRSATVWLDGAVLLRQLAREAGLRRRVDVQLHASVPGPMTCGVVRPAILLPVDAVDWCRDDLRQALIHELEHVRRGDWATQCAARAVCALYWFHPLAWKVWRRLGLEAERACDDAVVRRAEPTAYAGQLVLLAERLSTAASPPLLAMAACRDLTTRVRAVLDAGQTRGRAGAARIAAATGLSIAIVAMVAPLRAVPQDQPAASSPAAAAKFEVASVRRNTSGDNRQTMRREPGGRLLAQNMPLRALITFAYQLQGFQLVGAPDWIASERFDITAKAEAEPPIVSPFSRATDPMRAMLQNLLADRFGLLVHTEMREMPIFELVPARRDGRTPPALRRSTVDCAALMAKDMTARGAATPVNPQAASAAAMQCRLMVGAGRIVSGGSPIEGLAGLLAPLVQRVVVDRTGLTGNWDFEVTFTPEPAQLPGPPGQPAGLPPGVDPNGPSLFTALEEQIGLKLQPARGQVEVLVIDRVERPAED